MGRKSKFFIVYIAFILIFVFGLAFSFNSTALAQEIPTATSEILETATPSVVPPDILGTEIPTTKSPYLIPTIEPTSIQTSTPAIEVSPVSGQVSTITGRFSIIWGDFKTSAKTEPVSRYVLTDKAGKSTNLILNGELFGLNDDGLSYDQKNVIVEGTWSEVSAPGQRPALQVTSISLTRSQELSKSIKSAYVSGSKPFLSILCKFNDVDAEPKDLSYFWGMYDPNYPKLGHYWRQVSYEQMNIDGSTGVGWTRMHNPKSYYVYDINGDGYLDIDFDRAAVDCLAMADPTVNFENFRYGGINLMFNDELDGYAWSGSYHITLDGIDQNWSLTWEPPWAYSELSIIAQQMGNAFGLPYSSGHGIENNNVWDLMGDNWDSCVDYIDLYSGCLPQHPNAFHKKLLGWIPPFMTFTLANNTEATINLEQLALPASNNYLLAEVPILGSTTHYYTVEVRNLTGYDDKLPAKAVIIHEVDTERSIPSDVIDLDATNYTGDAGAQWHVGEKFVNSTNKVTIEVLSESATGFQVKVKSGLVPVGYGTYDERSAFVDYTGSWVAQAVTGNYLNTEKYSKVIGSTAQFTFTGEELSVIYRGYPAAFGNMGVAIDEVSFGTINQNTSTQKKQLRWSSGNLGTGTHTIVLTHLTGTYVSLDGLIVSGPPAATSTITNTLSSTLTRTPTPTLTPRPPVGNGSYDERSADVVYTGSWVAQAITGNYLNTEKYSKVIGSTASFTFSGEGISVIYRGYPTAFGNMGVAIDGESAGTIVQNTVTQQKQLRWNSVSLEPGPHTIVLTHLTGPYVSLDGFIVSGPPPATPTATNTFTPTTTYTPTPTLTPLSPVGNGAYDDRSFFVVYTGSWVAQRVFDNYQNTETYSTLIGSTARFTFMGEEVQVIYRGFPVRFGNMGVTIDGVDCGVFDQNTPSEMHKSWFSGKLDAGTHTIVLTHLTGTYVSLDGLFISGQGGATATVTNTLTPTMTPTETLTPTQSLTPTETFTPTQSLTPTETFTPTQSLTPTETFTPTPSFTSTGTSISTSTNTTTPTQTSIPPVGIGTYDERNTHILYSGSWVAQPVSGNYMNTEKYSKTIGSTARFTFTGEQISVIYRGYPVRFGNMGVTIDGADYGSINQNTSTQKLQLRWNSGNLDGGSHTIVLTHLTGTYVSLDGFVVTGSPAVTATVGPTSTASSTPTASPTPNGGPTATPVPLYAYNLVHSGNFGSQTLANCHAIGYAHKVTGGTGSLYIRIYVDNVLVGGKFSNTGGSIDFDLTNLPSFTFAPDVEHEVRMMAILENSQPYDLINPVTHQPGGLLTCQ